MSQILRNVSRGSFYLTVEQLSIVISSLLYSVVVLRWLGPFWFGLLTLALSIVGLASMFTGNFEIYLERYAAEFEERRDHQRLLAAHLWALAFKAVLGVGAALALHAILPWIAGQYGFVRLPVLILLLLPVIVFDGFSSTGRATLYGLQKFGWVAGLAVAQNGIKLAAVIALWLAGRGPAALAAMLSSLTILTGIVASGLAIAETWSRARRAGPSGPRPVPAPLAIAIGERTVPEMSWMGPRASDPAPGAPGPRGEHGVVTDMLRYCLPLLGARAAFLSGQNLSKVILGRFFPPEALGLFAFAFQTVERFVGLVYAIPSSLLPSLTQLHSQGDWLRLRRLLDKGFRLVATLGAVLSFLILIFAQEITRVIGGSTFLPAVGLLQVLALVPWVRTAQQPLTMGFYALRRTQVVLGLALLKFSVELGSYLLFIPVLGLPGAAWANLVGAVAAFTGALVATDRALGGDERHRWTVMAKTGTIVLLGVAAAFAMRSLPFEWHVLFVVKVALVVPVLLVVILLFDLVTLDDLARAQGIDIRARWMRAVRDRVVRSGAALQRAFGRRRPLPLGTAEGH